MSELIELEKRHMEEIDSLRARCPHRPKWIKIHQDSSVVGLGSSTPSVHVVCQNCGVKKIIFRKSGEEKRKVQKTLKKQGFKDERLNCAVQHSWELVS